MRGALFVAGFLSEVFGLVFLVVAVDSTQKCAGYPPCSANPLTLPIGVLLLLLGLILMSVAYLIADEEARYQRLR